ncbi:MAG TPA: D-alanyl-D-alanine carboxypeptidase/D-alanyl-D-alanine-endopeptidase [Chitinophagaceae bacterium]|nr:D-alanyl-D-alanine carboxypeptidase/D-alanyl-D-alanine-endopeptidase [Chitinophagaceae bacterium]
MKNVFLLAAGCLLLVLSSYSQTLSQRINKAFAAFEKDEQLKHAISSLFVIDAKTGQVVFDKNSQIGLAPASTQKIITSVTAFELLGKNYRYKTNLGYVGEIVSGKLKGDIIVTPSGDPTFGSWRWPGTSEETLLKKFVNSIVQNGINDILGSVDIIKSNWSTQFFPDGWIVQDIGNYYGAGSVALNWRENQFEIFLKSGDAIGDSVKITGYKPRLFSQNYISEVRSAKKGSGDNAYIYQNPNVIRGTIPVGENNFVISGSMQVPSREFQNTFGAELLSAGIDLNAPDMSQFNYSIDSLKTIYTHYSPSLDSIIYWFNKKSINLYGEALVKTFAYEKQGFGSTDSGVAIVKKFWKERGLDEDELNIYDGSGLSPLNRVTTHAQVAILKYAQTRDWFPYFLKSLPEYNGMTMKSGTISDVKGYCGYHKAQDGKEYIFSFLVNNYSGKSSQLVGKMFKVLDELK